MRPGTSRGTAALLIVLAAVTHAAAEETYVGTVAMPEGGAPIPITVTVREYTSDERANELAQMLHKAGHSAVRVALDADTAGEVRLGEDSYRVTLARQEPTASGRILRLTTDRPLRASAKTPPPAAADTVGFVELTLGAKDTGEGRVFSAVRAKFDAEGFVAPESAGGAPPWPVTGVKRRP